MLSLQDCLDFSDLDTGEIEAIARHEHIPLICAAEMGCELLKTHEGLRELHTIVLDDLNEALEQGEMERAGHWAEVYRHLQRAHPLGSQAT